MTEPIKSDAAVSFLEALRPNGPWNLTAIIPDGPVASATFTDPQRARAWIGARRDRANLYYVTNPAPEPSGSGGRVNKSDIPVIENLHVDVDCDKQDNGLSLDQRKAVARERLEQAEHPPTFIVDTGGGLQAIWKLAEPMPATPENIAWAEGANRWLVEAYGGDHLATDISRLLRLAGTTNCPDKRKRSRGRVTAPTRLLSATGELHGREAFGQVARAPKASVTDAEAIACRPLIEEVTDIDALVARYGLSERVRAIIVDGRAPGETKPGDDSRDKWLFDGCCQMVRAGVPVGVIAGVLLNSEWAISGHVYDHRGRDTDVYAMRQALRARAAVLADQRAEIEEMGDVDEQWLEDGDPPETLNEAEERIGGLTDGPKPEKPAPIDWQAWFRENWTAIGQRDVATIPPTPWLTEGLLLYGDVTTIGGRGGSGKSLLAWQIVCSVATGKALAWWPAPERPRKVLVISGEDSVDEIERRVSAACQAMGISRADLGDNFLVWNHRSIRLALKDDKTGKVTLTDLWRGIRWAVENLGVGLIVLDPLIKGSSGFEESRNDHMDELYGIIRDLVVGYPCAALTVDHFAKAGTGGDQASIRGASAKVDASRVALTLTAMTEEEFTRIRPRRPREAYVLCVDPKQNYAKKTGGHWLELVEREVGNGEQRPSLVWRNLGTVGEFFDPLYWEHRDEFLRLVAEGCVREDKETRPWSAAVKGPRDVRLTVAVAEQFDLDEKQARELVAAFETEGSIRAEDWEGSDRTMSKVWALNPEFQTEDDVETEAMRA